MILDDFWDIVGKITVCSAWHEADWTKMGYPSGRILISKIGAEYQSQRCSMGDSYNSIFTLPWLKVAFAMQSRCRGVSNLSISQACLPMRDKLVY